MLVNRHNFDQALSELAREKILATDTETTGIWWWKSPHVAWYEPRVFSIQFSSEKASYYLDVPNLDEVQLRQLQREVFANPETLWFIHRAKFDMHQLKNHELEIAGTVHCTQSLARVMNNTEFKTNLDALSQKYLGAEKLDVVTYMKENGLFTKVKKYGHNEKVEDWLHFDRLPLEMLVNYGERDTKLCRDLGMLQVAKIMDVPKLEQVMHNERALTKVLFDMERQGVKIDIPYTERAYENEVSEYKRIEAELNTINGAPLDWNSAKQLKPLFDRLGEPYSYTEKGNASFDRDALEESESQLAKSILQYRYHYKRAHTYFENFLWLSDTDGVLHADAQQAGTQFARMSYWDPNLQNVPKRRDKQEKNFKVRKCFVPKSGAVLADFDYSGAEFVMALDYAREMRVIELIQNGLDPHADLAERMVLKDRDTAKTMQFRILYGAGQAAVGKSLGYKGAEAQRIGKQKKAESFDRLPMVADLIARVSATAMQRGYIMNWLGRVLNYDRTTSYKSTNGLIQSGVGDMTKVAMVRLHPLFKGRRSYMVIQVHDAILFNLYPEDFDLIPLIKSTMAGAYPHKVIGMSVDAGFSALDWSSLQDELPAL